MSAEREGMLLATINMPDEAPSKDAHGAEARSDDSKRALSAPLQLSTAVKKSCAKRATFVRAEPTTLHGP